MSDNEHRRSAAGGIIIWIGLIGIVLATTVVAKCNPFPGWMPQDFPNKHRPREK